MGRAFFLFHSNDYARPTTTGNPQGAPSPAKWKHHENFTVNAEESVSHHTRSLKHTE